MPVNDTTNDNQRSAGAQMSEAYSGGQQNGTQAQQSQGGSSRPTFSLRRAGAPFRHQISKTQVSANLRALEQALLEVYKDPNYSDLDIKVIVLDQVSHPDLACSAIIVTERLKNVSNGGLVSYHTLLIEPEGQLRSNTETYEGQQYTIQRLPSDLWNDMFRKYVADAVSAAVKTQNILEVGGCLVQKDFKIDESQASKDLVLQLAGNALEACNTELEHRLESFMELDLNYMTKNEPLETRILLTDASAHDVTGRPYRADVRIMLNSIGRQQNQNQDQVVETVSEVHGYMDVDYVGPIGQQPFSNPFQQGGSPHIDPFAAAAQQQVATGYYQPKFVITHLETIENHTLAATLLALVQVMMLRQQAIWTQGFWPRQVDQKIDLRDIGALGYEVPIMLGEDGRMLPIDTKVSTFSPQHRAALLKLLFRPEIAFEIDVDAAGPDTWFLEILSAIAVGKNADALTEFVRSANALTGGKFSQIYNAHPAKTGQIVMYHGNRIARGTYRDPNGDLRDTRDFDHIAFANLNGATEPAKIQAWQDSFWALNVPAPIREARRRSLISSVCQPVFDSYAYRLTLEAAAMESLAEACFKSGLVSTPKLPDTGVIQHERATAQYQGAVLSGSAQMGLFSGSYGAAPQGNFGNYGNYGQFSNRGWNV